MKTKEAIRFLKNTIFWNLGDEAPIGKEKYQNLINNTIQLLERGEKFGAMWLEIVEYLAEVNGNFHTTNIIAKKYFKEK